MQIIIPMTGNGSRFKAAGYTDLKPFIKVNDMPIIEWIVRGMYGNEKIIFVCRKEHLNDNAGIREYLQQIAPDSEIFEIDNWVKKGPVYDVLRAINTLDENDECIINYCDFFMTWDFEKFKSEVKKRNADGAIPCYSGFHPHLTIQKNVYASCKVDEFDNLVEIKEKFSFEKDKTKALHSPGVYYFKNAKLMGKYCKALVDSQNAIDGEFYASLVYNQMVKDGLKVWCPSSVQQFCQWGTPEDLQDYNFYVQSILSWAK